MVTGADPSPQLITVERSVLAVVDTFVISSEKLPLPQFVKGVVELKS
jgi:hypothetical protein